MTKTRNSLLSPIQTNLASSSHTPSVPQPETTTMEIDPQTSTATENVTIPQAHESPQTLPQAAPSSNTTPPTLVERIRILENKTLRRLVPVAFATSGRPRITIPDSIFQKGAEIHRDFIICYFNGRAPPFSQISKCTKLYVGKGKKIGDSQQSSEPFYLSENPK